MQKEPAQPSAEEKINEAGETATGELSEAAQQLSEGDFSALLPLLEKYVVPTVAALIILLVAYFAAKMISRIASTPIRRRVDETLGRFVQKLIYYSIMVFALLGVLGMFGISVASFAAVLAAAGFAVGLAFQGTLSNFAAGVLLLVFRPFKVGDVVSAAGITAKVFEIDLFHTIFDTFDNRRIIVPNGQISSGIIENISHHHQRRVDISVGVDYSASLEQTRDVLTAAVQSQQEKIVEGEGRGFQIALTGLGASSVDWAVRVWTRSEDFFELKEALTAAVKNHLDQAGIGIPYPQMDVHLVGENAEGDK